MPVTMIRISNISDSVVAIVTRVDEVGARPLRVGLGPGEDTFFPAVNFAGFSIATKQDIAEYAAHGKIKVEEINSVHLFQDKGNIPKYGEEYLYYPGQASYANALLVAADLHDKLNNHFTSLSFHQAATPAITTALPTSVPTLVTWVGDAQTAYAAHVSSGVYHPYVDSTNTLTPVAATDLETSINALRELYRAFKFHKMWLNPPATAVDINKILDY